MNTIFKNPHLKYYLVFGFAAIVAIIITISIITQPPATKIDNLSRYDKSIPKEVKSRLEESLYKIISFNGVTNIPSRGALIRDNTFYSEPAEDDNDSIYVNFIVDIDSVNQSYFAQYQWSKNTNDPNISSTSILLMCIHDPDDIIYPDFKCKDDFTFNPSTDDPFIFLSEYLPYPIALSSEYATITSVKKPDLNIEIPTCTTDNQTEAIKKTRSFIESLYINPDDFTIITNCDN
ncbi:hypothetical protein IKD60_03210 [Candidatus Saccharibacteria bacterium]|nr:hypothetical protein [Candidatus Saccharibacteria bacterium]